MRILVQRVKRAQVRVINSSSLPENITGGKENIGLCVENAPIVGQIGAGLCVLVGITHTDGEAEVAKVARRISELKILRGIGEAGVTDDPAQRISVLESQAVLGDSPTVLLVSQFTLYADVRKGRKPSWSKAAPGAVAAPLFAKLVLALQELGIKVATGEFGAMMDVELVNDGPFTIFYET